MDRGISLPVLNCSLISLHAGKTNLFPQRKKDFCAVIYLLLNETVNSFGNILYLNLTDGARH